MLMYPSLCSCTYFIAVSSHFSPSPFSGIGAEELWPHFARHEDLGTAACIAIEHIYALDKAYIFREPTSTISDVESTDRRVPRKKDSPTQIWFFTTRRELAVHRI
jgi:hypothetical protein